LRRRSGRWIGRAMWGVGRKQVRLMRHASFFKLSHTGRRSQNTVLQKFFIRVEMTKFIFLMNPQFSSPLASPSSTSTADDPTRS
jgi:hypothetical protein